MSPSDPAPFLRNRRLLLRAALPLSMIIFGGVLLHRTPGTRVGARPQAQSSGSEPAITSSHENAQSTPPTRPRPERRSSASATESGHFGNIELIDVGDSTPDFSDFVAEQAKAAHDSNQHCLLMTMLPKCPSCAAIGYAVEKGLLGRDLGRIRLIRLDLDEFEQEVRRLHLPIDRVPGFVLVDATGSVVDFLDGGEWGANDPAEFAPIISAFVNGRLAQRRYLWTRLPQSRAIDL